MGVFQQDDAVLGERVAQRQTLSVRIEVFVVDDPQVVALAEVVAEARIDSEEIGGGTRTGVLQPSQR